MRNYKLETNVDWLGVLKTIENRLLQYRHKAIYSLETLNDLQDRKHPDFAAVSIWHDYFCDHMERVFKEYAKLNDLRTFLAMKPKTCQQLRIANLIDRYMQITNNAPEADSADIA